MVDMSQIGLLSHETGDNNIDRQFISPVISHLQAAKHQIITTTSLACNIAKLSLKYKI